MMKVVVYMPGIYIIGYTHHSAFFFLYLFFTRSFLLHSDFFSCTVFVVRFFGLVRFSGEHSLLCAAACLCLLCVCVVLLCVVCARRALCKKKRKSGANVNLLSFYYGFTMIYFKILWSHWLKDHIGYSLTMSRGLDLEISMGQSYAPLEQTYRDEGLSVGFDHMVCWIYFWAL